MEASLEADWERGITTANRALCVLGFDSIYSCQEGVPDASARLVPGPAHASLEQGPAGLPERSGENSAWPLVTAGSLEPEAGRR